MTKMKEIRVEKVVINIGVGKGGEQLENAVTLLSRMTGRKAVQTSAKKRNPTWGLRKGLRIGTKVTLRGSAAVDFLKKAFEAAGGKIYKQSFDQHGNFSFGVKEYIDFPGMKYDPNIGMFGFDVCVSLTRPGYRVARRKIGAAKIGSSHLIKPEEAQKFVETTFGVKVVDKVAE